MAMVNDGNNSVMKKCDLAEIEGQLYIVHGWIEVDGKEMPISKSLLDSAFLKKSALGYLYSEEITLRQS